MLMLALVGITCGTACVSSTSSISVDLILPIFLLVFIPETSKTRNIAAVHPHNGFEMEKNQDVNEQVDFQLKFKLFKQARLVELRSDPWVAFVVRF